VRASAGGGADEQPRRAGTAQGGAVAEEVVRLRQRGGLPVRGADPDGGADAAPARPPGVALLATVAHRPSRASARSLTTPGMNGYRNRSVTWQRSPIPAVFVCIRVSSVFNPWLTIMDALNTRSARAPRRR